jgi:multiple sugar transport system substrate-binding protein
MGKLTTAALCCAVLLAGCGGDSSSEGDSNQIVVQVSAAPEEQRAYETLIENFESQHPQIDVKLVTVASDGDNLTKLATDFAAGRPPDLFLLNYRRFGQFAGKGQIDPAGPRLRASKVIAEDDFFPQALDGFTSGGELQCMPQNISSPVVYYNAALFEQAGVPKPAPDWTWNDMLEAAKKTATEDVYGIIFEPNLNRLAPFIWSNGGEVVDDTERPTKLSLLEKPDMDAINFLVDLRHKHHVFPELTESEAEDPEAAFIAGRAAMFIDSRRATTTLRAAEDLEWDVAAFPASPRTGEAVPMLHSDAYCMAKAARNKDAAWQFVEYAVGPEGGRVLAKTGRTVPSLKALADSEAFLDPSQAPANAQVWLDQIPKLRRFPNIPTWNEIESKASVVTEEWFFSTEPPEALGFEIDIATLELFEEASE